MAQWICRKIQNFNLGFGNVKYLLNTSNILAIENQKNRLTMYKP